MFETRITKLLGIKYPIVQGGIIWLAKAELAAAVSNAGGLGIITSASYYSKEELRDDIRKAKSLTDKPFGVNISLAPTQRPIKTEDYIDVLANEGVRVVETSGRSPEPYMKQLKAAKITVLHKAPGAIRFAQTAEQIGCDAVSIVGFECGGHPGLDDVTILILARAAAKALKIPFLAAGGFTDAEGFVAALALGADGILMGTRFIATQECPAHPKFKEWILSSKETDTVITQRSIRAPARSLKSEATQKVMEMESRGATLQELLTITSGEMGKRVYMEGELNAGMADCGQAVGLISDIPTVKELIDGIVHGAEEIVKKKLLPMAQSK